MDSSTIKWLYVLHVQRHRAECYSDCKQLYLRPIIVVKILTSEVYSSNSLPVTMPIRYLIFQNIITSCTTSERPISTNFIIFGIKHKTDILGLTCT